MGALLALLGASSTGPARAAATPLPALRLHTTGVETIETEPLLQEWRRGPKMQATAVVTDPLLTDRIQHLQAESPTFRRAWEELSAAGIPLVIGSSEELASVMPGNIRDSDYWAGITLTWPTGRHGELHRGAVVIRVGWLRELHDEYGTPPDAFLAALDGLIIHEVYGHLAPVVAARNLSAHCPDPVGGQRLADSCVGKRELALNRERPRTLAATGR